MDQSTFTNLTGISLTASQVARFSAVAGMAGETIEELLGWPLDPTDIDDQYTEIGKLSEDEDWGGFDTDTPISQLNLQAPDEVQGQLRVFQWDEHDQYLFIDPAVELYAVKLVKDGITYVTFKPQHYRLQLVNGRETYGRYVQINRSWLPGYFWPLLWYQMPGLVPYEQKRNVQVAVDADWFPQDDLPLTIKRSWADQIAYEMDIKRDIKSETHMSHSYTKDARDDSSVKHLKTLVKYAGPNGTIQRPEILV